MVAQVSDTYVAALQHDLVELTPDTHRLGVVRKPTPWFHGAVDDNDRRLGPPAALLEELAARQEELAAAGHGENATHNAAWEECSFPERYRAYLETDEAQAAIADVLGTLEAGTDVALVCYENTDRKRCHRTILRDYLDARS